MKALYPLKCRDQHHISEDHHCENLRPRQDVKFVLDNNFWMSLQYSISTRGFHWFETRLLLLEGKYGNCDRHVTGAIINTHCSTASFIIISWFTLIS
jgi:hypothetical protein